MRDGVKDMTLIGVIMTVRMMSVRRKIKEG